MVFNRSELFRAITNREMFIEICRWWRLYAGNVGIVSVLGNFSIFRLGINFEQRKSSASW